MKAFVFRVTALNAVGVITAPDKEAAYPKAQKVIESRYRRRVPISAIDLARVDNYEAVFVDDQGFHMEMA
jgi:hypothetical protein